MSNTDSCKIISKSDHRFLRRLRISSCPYSEKSPHSPESCLWTDQNFANSIWKRSPKEHSCEIISKSDQRFRRRKFFKNFFIHPYSGRSPHSPEPCLWTDQNFANNFWKGLPKEHSCEIISKLDQRFQRKDFLSVSSCLYSARSSHSPEPCFGWIKISRTVFEKGHPRNIPVKLFENPTSSSRRFVKNCLKTSISLPWQPEFLMESNSANNFWRGPPKEHSCQVWSKLANQFGKRCLKKLLTTHRCTTNTPP